MLASAGDPTCISRQAANTSRHNSTSLSTRHPPVHSRWLLTASQALVNATLTRKKRATVQRPPLILRPSCAAATYPAMAPGRRAAAGQHGAAAAVRRRPSVSLADGTVLSSGYSVTEAQGRANREVGASPSALSKPGELVSPQRRVEIADNSTDRASAHLHDDAAAQRAAPRWHHETNPGVSLHSASCSPQQQGTMPRYMTKSEALQPVFE